MSAVRLARAATQPRPGDQVRRLLPRPRRRAARERRLGPDDARHPVHARRAARASPPTRSCCRTTTSTRWPRPSPRYGEGLAAILVEPVAGNMGVVPPAPGFLEALRPLCDALGRAARLRRGDHRLPRRTRRRAGALRRHAGPHGARQDRRRRPAGGGVRRPAELMERLAPVGDVYQAGTLSGNPLATAAGMSVLRRLRDPAVYEELERRGARLEAGLAPFGTVQRVGAMLTLFCQDGAGARLRRRRAVRHGPVRGALPSPARRTASTWRRRSSSACSSRSPTATRRSTDDRGRCATSSKLTEPGTLGRRLGVADEAARESPLWAAVAAARRRARARARLLDALADPAFALGVETIYEGYLLHYGASAAVRAGRRRTRRSCSATTSTRTASCASRRREASTRCTIWRS